MNLAQLGVFAVRMSLSLPTSVQLASEPISGVRLVVVAPTFDNAGTLLSVLEGVQSLGLDIIAVNDGSTDETRAKLAGWAEHGEDGRHVLHHDQNRGKAAAMRTGFARALELGFTHALTIDTDGQHDPADAAGLIRAVEREPQAIVVGIRPCGRGYPLRSRLGRTASNALVEFIAGARVQDTQCGLRIYPIGTISTLKARTSRYAFETEILVRAAWANVPIVGVPVRCIYDLPGGRVTHFRVLRDSLSAAAMHARLLTRSLVPWSPRKIVTVHDGQAATGTLFDRGRRWLNPLRAWRSLRLDPAERERIGASMGWGLFIGTQPPLGYKGALCLIVAKVFRLQPLIVLGTSSLSTPPMGFVLWSAAIVVGHVLLHGTVPSASQYDMAVLGPLRVLRAVALEWVVGGLVFGSALGVSTWLIMNAIVRGLSHRSPVVSHEPA